MPELSAKFGPIPPAFFSILLMDPDGVALKCTYCDRPAVIRGWGWHRLWGVLPVFPRHLNWCEIHEPTTG